MIVDRALVPNEMVIPCSLGSLHMVDHTLIGVPLANVYLDSPYCREHCMGDMCQPRPPYPVIIGNVRNARQMFPDPDWKAEDQQGTRARTSGGNSNDNDDQGGDMPTGCSKRSPIEKTKKGDSNKKPAQLKKNDRRATQDCNV